MLPGGYVFRTTGSMCAMSSLNMCSIWGSKLSLNIIILLPNVGNPLVAQSKRGSAKIQPSMVHGYSSRFSPPDQFERLPCVEAVPETTLHLILLRRCGGAGVIREQVDFPRDDVDLRNRSRGPKQWTVEGLKN